MDLICYSHLRWNFVYQRPQHLISRMIKYFRVFYVEEPIFDVSTPKLEITRNEALIWIVVPHLPADLCQTDRDSYMHQLLGDMFNEYKISTFIAWYYTPMALPYSFQTSPQFVVYDCMDELSAFKDASPALHTQEAALMRKADLVFTGGYSLFEAKRHLHHNIYLFPSSIDKEHFSKAREYKNEMPDQKNIEGPRIGFFGVIDERMDLQLLDTVARRRPAWNFIMIGPVAKISTAVLPCLSNIHYLGQKSYDELPGYIAGWDVAIMPFAINECTRYISPTKTPEYLAAGKQVVSTSVADVVRSYGDTGLIYIADFPDTFVESIEAAMVEKNYLWLEKVDVQLRLTSWDTTFTQMMTEIFKLFDAQESTTRMKDGKYV